MIVKLTYFKPTGKYYASGEYETKLPHHWLKLAVKTESGMTEASAPHLFEIWAEVEAMIELRRCPDLIEGHSDFLVAVDVPDHPHNHPHLIWPERYWRLIRDYEESQL